jgi:hypothetical protein
MGEENGVAHLYLLLVVRFDERNLLAIGRKDFQASLFFALDWLGILCRNGK